MIMWEKCSEFFLNVVAWMMKMLDCAPAILFIMQSTMARRTVVFPSTVCMWCTRGTVSEKKGKENSGKEMKERWKMKDGITGV